MRIIYRRDLVRAMGVQRGVIRELELRGIIPPSGRNEKGWCTYGKEHVKALLKWYERGRRIPPEGLIKLLEELEREEASENIGAK